MRAPAGKLISTDSYMNLQLGDAEEWMDGSSKGMLGEILIRCNNVMFIRAVIQPQTIAQTDFSGYFLQHC